MTVARARALALAKQLVASRDAIYENEVDGDLREELAALLRRWPGPPSALPGVREAVTAALAEADGRNITTPGDWAKAGALLAALDALAGAREPLDIADIAAAVAAEFCPPEHRIDTSGWTCPACLRRANAALDALAAKERRIYDCTHPYTPTPERAGACKFCDHPRECHPAAEPQGSI